MLTGNSLLKFNVLLEVGNLQIQKFGSGRILPRIRIHTGSWDVGSGRIRIWIRCTHIYKLTCFFKNFGQIRHVSTRQNGNEVIQFNIKLRGSRIQWAANKQVIFWFPE